MRGLRIPATTRGHFDEAGSGIVLVIEIQTSRARTRDETFAKPDGSAILKSPRWRGRQRQVAVALVFP
jgi:hypothetical protein